MLTSTKIFTLATVVLFLFMFVIVYTIYADIKSCDPSDSIANKFLSIWCRNEPAVFNPTDFEWSRGLRSSWKQIRDEFLDYTSDHSIPDYKNINDVVSSCNENGGWKTVFLRVFNTDTDASKMFPTTMKNIDTCPCITAFFSVLEPGAKLSPHRGVYKGVMRYHLGLIVPDDHEQCFINIDNTKLTWQNGRDIMFDDMFTHYVENNTDQCRVILFLDIKRDFKNPVINIINNGLLRFIKSNDVITDMIERANTENGQLE